MKRLACAIAVAAAAALIILFPSSDPGNDRPDSPTESTARTHASGSRDRPRLEPAAEEPSWLEPADATLATSARDLETAIDDLKAGADSYYDLDQHARAEYDRLHTSLAERGSLLPVATRLDPTNAQDFAGELDE